MAATSSACFWPSSARLYGKRRSERAQELSRLAREPLGEDELDDDDS